MGSVGNPSPYPWAPNYNDNFRDCSLQICSIYCPQFCYLIFPPPPPSEDDSDTHFSPLIIAIIGVLASALILVSYYTIVTKYCKRRNAVNRSSDQETGENHDDLVHDQVQTSSDGLNEADIVKITAFKYRKGDGLVEGNECAVCLSEFQENESLRLLPKCDHAFHLPCIDTWLQSHSNCPLCRANAVPSPISHVPPARVNMSSCESHRPDDLVLVVEDVASNCDHNVVVRRMSNDENVEDSRNGSVEEFETPVTYSPQRQLLVSDILRIEEIDEDLEMASFRSWRGIGSSKGGRV